jgi:hypothetical protein
MNARIIALLLNVDTISHNGQQRTCLQLFGSGKRNFFFILNNPNLVIM